ncbi:MAG: cytochrome c oxidase subunit II [Siculibacillus sp.]|nr:cytochrome c oxidase subunit II [Siculibacillus sp.]
MISKTTTPFAASPTRPLAASIAATAGLLASATAGSASQPQPWQIGLQSGASVVHDNIESFAAFTFWIIIPITLFVLGLLIWVMVKFNAKANPVPSRTTHHTGLEVAWTVVPILILVALAIPSFRLLYQQMVVPPSDMTIKVTGYQWYWGYEYSDVVDDRKKALAFDSVMLDDAKRKDPVRQPRLLAVDNEVVVPVGKVVRLQITAADVIHSWALPAFGVKMDANPGRLNETWFKAEKTGVYYGQCSELCGRDHAFMPIAVNVVTQEKFDAWAKTARSDLDAAYRQLAASEATEGEPTRLAAR